MKTKKLNFIILILSFFIFATCTKQSSDYYSNCKLKIADGRGGAAIGGFPRYPDRLDSVGTVKVTFIFVDFSDAPAGVSVASVYSKLANAKQFYTDQSYGNFNYDMSEPANVWHRMPRPSTEYSFNSGSHLDYVRDAVEAADDDIDFSDTDSLVIIQNPDSTDISDIGPSLPLSRGQGITADGNEMLNIVTSGNDLDEHEYLWLNHEVLHTLGLVDLYSSDPKSNDFHDLVPYTGGFSLMGVSSVNAMFAPSLTAWERYVLGWVSDSQVECVNPFKDGKVTKLITPINETGGRKAMIIRVGETKAVVIESRRAQDYDSNLSKEGALVYTVDSSVQSGKGPLRVYPAGDKNDSWFANSPRAAGESVSVEGLKIKVISSTADGDEVQVSAEKIQIDR
jgi:M6 family metalloprotease-like protein